jgi:uncharacterized protein (DUF1778 family)
MYQAHHDSGKREIAITIRTTKWERSLIDQAAEKLGMTRTEFLLESACNEAQQVLLDTNYFGLSAETFKKFSDLLDAPPQNIEGLRRLLKTKAPWE